MFGKMEALTLTLTSTSLERTGGKLAEKIKYADIRRIDVHEKPSGKIAYIKVQSASTSIDIHGFERLDEIAQCLEENVSDRSLVHRKRHAIEWSTSAPDCHRDIDGDRYPADSRTWPKRLRRFQYVPPFCHRAIRSHSQAFNKKLWKTF